MYESWNYGTMNQRLDAETLSVVADEFGFELDFVKTDIRRRERRG